jgi:hypothetical protein
MRFLPHEIDDWDDECECEEEPDTRHRCVLVDLLGDNVMRPDSPHKYIIHMPDCSGLEVVIHGNIHGNFSTTFKHELPLDHYHDKAELILY